MQYTVDYCGIIGLLSCVTLPSKTTVHSSCVWNSQFSAPCSCLLHLRCPGYPLHALSMQMEKKNLPATTLKSAVDQDGVEQAGKLSPPSEKLCRVDTSDTAHA